MIGGQQQLKGRQVCTQPVPRCNTHSDVRSRNKSAASVVGPLNQDPLVFRFIHNVQMFPLLYFHLFIIF